MFKKIAEKFTAYRKFSWEMMVNSGQVCFLLMFQVMPWGQEINSTLTRTLAGTTLLFYGILWILHGIYPLFLENRPTSVTISGKVIIASGCCIIGLGIAMIVPLMPEVNWMPRMAGIFYSFAFSVWLFVSMKLAPIITRRLLIGIVLCAIATGYAFVCNIVVVINALASDIFHVKASWDLAIGYFVSGVAMTAWTILVMRKNTPAGYKGLVPVCVIAGVIYIGFGIVMATVLISR